MSSASQGQMSQFRVGQYLLEKKLGEGGMAEVWKARHELLGIQVAIKFLSPSFAGIADVEQRFLGEGKRQAQLCHLNIVSASDFLYIDERSYLIMKFIDGESLEEYLFRLQTPVPLNQFLDITGDLSAALDYAHSQNVIHRDIKPSNVLLERSTGRAYVMDFGIALVLGEQRKTRIGTTIGTPHYMSPEQIIGSKTLDHRSDIYSLGCVLYQMLTGKMPFDVAEGEGDTAYRIKEKHLRQPPVAPRQWNPYIPEHMEQAVLRCLEKDPSQRFNCCQDLMTALGSAPTSHTPTAYPGAQAKRTGTIIETALPLRPRSPVTPNPTPASSPMTTPPPPPLQNKPATTGEAANVINPPQTPQANGKGLFIGLAAIVLSGAIGGGYYLYSPSSSTVTPAPIVDAWKTAHPGTVGNTPKPSPVPAPLPKPQVVAKKESAPTEPVNTETYNTPVEHQQETQVEPRPTVPAPTPEPESHGPARPVEPVIATASVPSKPTIVLPSGPTEGNLTWSGEVAKNQLIQISGRSASSGSVAGDAFPGVPIQVSVTPNRFAVVSQPNPLNGFSQVSLRSTMNGHVSIVIHWTRLASQ